MGRRRGWRFRLDGRLGVDVESDGDGGIGVSIDVEEEEGTSIGEGLGGVDPGRVDSEEMPEGGVEGEGSDGVERYLKRELWGARDVCKGARRRGAMTGAAMPSNCPT